MTPTSPTSLALDDFFATLIPITDNGRVVGVLVPTSHNGAPMEDNLQRLRELHAVVKGTQDTAPTHWPGKGQIGGVFIPADQNATVVQNLMAHRERVLTSAGSQQGRNAIDQFLAEPASTAPTQDKDQSLATATLRVRRELAAIGVPQFDTVPGSNGTNIPVGQMTQDGKERLKAYLKESGLPVGEGMSKTSGEVITIFGKSPDSPEVQAVVDAQRKVNGPHAGTPHAPGQSPRGYARIGAMVTAAGIAGTVIAAGAALENLAPGASLKDKFKAVASVVAPAVHDWKNGKRAEAAAKVVDRFDPTGGYLSGGLRTLARAVGIDVEKGALEAAEKQNHAGVLANANWNQRIHREQEFIFSENHPSKICDLCVKDKDGKPIDIKAALRDPEKRKQVLGGIDCMQDTESRRTLREAANAFIALEDRRRPDFAQGAGPGIQKQVAAVPVSTGPG